MSIMSLTKAILLCAILKCDILSVSASQKVNCSRIDSDVVRKFVNEKIIPAYDKLNALIPENCLWNKDRDVFGGQYLMMKRVSDDNWRCDYCGKEFYSQSYLWQHMDSKHDDQLYRGSNPVCLADLCPVVRCEIISGGQFNRPPRINWPQKLCSHREMQALQSRCNVVIEQCLLPEMPQYHILKGYLITTVCNFLTCENYWESSLKTPRKWAINIYIAITVFIIGLVVYYIALFVRLNKIDMDRLEKPSQFDKLSVKPHHKYRGLDLTYRGKRIVDGKN